MKHLFGNIFKFAGYSIAVFAVLLLCIHFWFKYNSERTIEQLVYWGSNGKLNCSIEKFESNYFDNSIHIQGISIFTVNNSEQATSYKFIVKDFHFRTRSRWDLFVHKQLLIDSIVFNKPEIFISKRNSLQADSSRKIVLIEDLEKLYSSIHKSLDVLNLQLFKIKKGKLVVRNEDSLSLPPLVVNNIDFSINKLNIDSSSVKDSSRFIFSERVFLRIANQKIMLADNKSNIAFKELLIDSKEKLVRLSGAAVYIFPSSRQRSTFDIQSKKLSIIGLDFNALYQKQLIEADSVFLEKPYAVIDFFAGSNARKNKVIDKRNLFDSTLNQLPVSFDLGHLVMQNGGASTTLHHGGKTTHLSATNDNVSISGFHLNDSGKKELKIRGFNYTIRNYTGFLPDSTLRFNFDSLQFINDKIVLHNFAAITPRNERNKVIRNYAIPRLEITGMDWLSFIFKNSFKASEAVLHHPIVTVEKNDSFQNESSGKSRRSIYQNLSLMDKIIDLEKLQIISGDISLKQADALEFQLKNLDLDIDIEKLGKARSSDQLIGSLKQLSFGKAAVSTPHIFVTTGHSSFQENEKKLVFDSIRVVTKHGDIDGIFKQVDVQDFSFENNQLDISSLSWKDAVVHIDTREHSSERGNKSKRTLWFLIEKLSGNHTWLHFADKQFTGKVLLKNISVNTISRESNSAIQSEGLTVMGGDASFNLPSGLLQLDGFDIRDKQHSLARNVLFRRQTQLDSLIVSLPSLSFTPYLEQSFISKALTMDSVRINQPNITFFSQGNDHKLTQSTKPLILPGFNIQGFEIQDALFQAHTGAIVTSGKHISVNIAHVKTEPDNAFVARRISVEGSDILFDKTNEYRAGSERILLAEFDHFRYHMGSKDWDMKLNKLQTNHIDFKGINPEKYPLLLVDQLSVENLKMKHSDMKTPLSYFINHSGASLKFDSLQWQNEKSKMQLGQLRFDGKQRWLVLHSFALNPSESRAEFYNRLIYRKIYMTTKTGEIQADGLELKEEGLRVSRILVNAAALDVYANKLKKLPPAIIQPLPLMALHQIGFPFQIDEMLLQNASVNYTELNHISKDTGSINFSSVNARISNISSNPNEESDSLRANISAIFYDKMPLQVALSQSYRDTLSGLRLGIKLGSGKLTALNPFLAPLVSIRARSGYLDSMQMTAVGNEYMSKGLMTLHYHHLKADLLDSGNVSKQKFRTRLIGFLANTIAVKDKNTKNEASFIFVRNRQKSTIFYFLRMVVGGVASSVAPASNIFFRKQYKKSLKSIPEQSRLTVD